MNLSRVDPLNKNQPSFKRTLTGLKVAFTKGCHCTQTHGESATGAGVVSLLVPDGLWYCEARLTSCDHLDGYHNLYVAHDMYEDSARNWRGHKMQSQQ